MVAGIRRGTEFRDVSVWSPASLPKDPTHIKAILAVLVEAGRGAVRRYTQICSKTAGEGLRTYDLALAILNEALQYESWPSKFLGEEPSGHSCVKDLRRPWPPSSWPDRPQCSLVRPCRIQGLTSVPYGSWSRSQGCTSSPETNLLGMLVRAEPQPTYPIEAESTT
jgi:hypothetical protein